jgi:hypothetical protein
MTEVVSKNPETGEMMNKFMTDRSKNPIEFDTKVYYLYELTNGFQDLGNIQKTVASKTVKDFEKSVLIFETSDVSATDETISIESSLYKSSFLFSTNTPTVIRCLFR